MITKRQLGLAATMFRKLGIDSDEASLVVEKFGDAETIEAMTSKEAHAMIKYLLKEHPRAKAMNKMRKKFIYLASMMDFDKRQSKYTRGLDRLGVILVNIDAWLLSKKSKHKKKLNDLAFDELRESLNQFENIYISYISALVK